MGNLVFQAALGGQVSLAGPNTASTLTLNVPAVNGNLVTTGDTGSVTDTMIANSTITSSKLASTTGSGSVVLATSPTITGLTFTDAAGASPAFAAYNNSGTTMSNGAYVKVTFDTKYFDTNTNYSTANSRFTPTVAGYYQINASFVYLGTFVTQVVLGLYKNGSLLTYSNHFGTTANNASSINLSTILQANGSTDYFEIYCYMTGTGTLSVQGGQQSFFNAAMIRST